MALFKTSAEARDILERFRRATSIRPNLWARAALAHSLSVSTEPGDQRIDNDGQEFGDNVFFGPDEESLIALLRQHLGRVPPQEEYGRLIKTHVERGLRLFNQEFERLNCRGDEFMLHLVKLASADTDKPSPAGRTAVPPTPMVDSFALRVPVGTSLHTGQDVVHLFNGPGGTPHLAIMGKNGTGKTRTGLSLLESVSASANYYVPFLVFDYSKGDIAANTNFLKATGARVVSVPENQVPLSPLALPSRDEIDVHLAARRFRNTIASVVRLGPIQQERCLRMITELYMESKDTTPELKDLVILADQEYNLNGWNEDSLLACLHEFDHFPLFPSPATNEAHPFFRESHVIDIHRLPEDLRKLTVFMILDRLYSEIMALPDAPLDDGNNRQQRLLIVIDEAHHYLPCRQQTLQDLVREVRSKGVGIWLFSQSPDDFDQQQYNFAREMGISIIFSCVAEKPRMLEALLGGKVERTVLSRLRPGVALMRAFDAMAPEEVQCWTP